jgi:glycosyltransferase involved in cell wall biosynthesis
MFAAMSADLIVHLDAPLPAELAVGAGTALFVAGWCYCDRGRVRSLSLVVDAELQAVGAHGMPRLDVLRALGHPHSYASGFWGMARISPRSRSEIEIGLRAELDGGGVVSAELGRIPVRELPAPRVVAAPEAGPLVAICMATYEPPLDLLERQLDSIRAQTHRNWVCVISDDCSTPERFADIEAAVAGDPRFVVSRSPARLGFYRNFERALSMAPLNADHVAMADQDDAWHPDKLATLLSALGDAQLVYSDARIVDRAGAVVSDTYWQERANNHTELLSLLVANAVTGAASLFPRRLLDDALPFPPAQFAHFHDHWIGLTALALGDIAFVDRPLYDYVQHREASLGHAAANRITALRDRVGRLRNDPRERVRMWRMHYFVDVARLQQFATILQLRCGDRMAPEKHQALDRFLAAERSLPALARLWGRGAREVLGRRTETLGAEWTLSYALTWRRALGATARERPNRRLRLDAVPPPNLAPRAGRPGLEGSVRVVAEKIAPLELAVRDDAPARVNLLIPTIDLEHLFGGYIAKLNLARRLAERGARVRIVTVDPVPPLPRDWRARVESYAGLSGLFDRVEVAFGREANGLEVSRGDRFVASTWWTAHVAARAAQALGGGRFLYLIQEHEPFTFPMGTFAALATESYRLPHYALFSTELLRDWFRRHAIGVYSEGAGPGDEASAAFENAITAVPPPSAGELSAHTTRRLLFYARPELHAARNMFELGVLALARAVEEGALAGWDLHGIGALRARRIELGAGATLELLPRSNQRAYADLLRDHDVGLALMYTPHPSLVPIEMASAGMVTVTNTFENKTAEAVAAISPNLLAVEPTIDAIAAGLREAVAAAGDAERRAAGSAVRWSRDWDCSFNDALMARVAGFLRS